MPLGTPLYPTTLCCTRPLEGSLAKNTLYIFNDKEGLQATMRAHHIFPHHRVSHRTCRGWARQRASRRTRADTSRAPPSAAARVVRSPASPAPRGGAHLWR